MSAPARVVLATVGRFHYGLLATELHERGALERFFSGFPRRYLRCPAIPDRLISTWPWVQFPYQVLMRWRLLGARAERLLGRAGQVSLDRYIARNLPDCDVYCAMSGCGVDSGAVALSRGIRFVCERGALHIREMDELLAAEYDRLNLPYFGTDPVMIEREEREYELAERIVTVSHGVAESFVRRGVARAKLRVVTPSVSTLWTPTARREENTSLRILFVGALSVIKGVGHLVNAFRRAALPGAELYLVGNETAETPMLIGDTGDAPIYRLGILPPEALAEEMRRADVLVVPSIGDGLPTVAIEALGCGCPVIISRNAGAADHVFDGENGFVIPPADVDAIAARLTQLYEDRDLLRRMRTAASASVARETTPGAYAARWLEATSGTAE